MKTKPKFSLVLQTEAADPKKAYQHFMGKLEFETDVADLLIDLKKGCEQFTIIDVRDPKSYEECHIPGAHSLPTNRINTETTPFLDKQKTLITYCWGPACNGATKAAAKFAELGFRVKELIGGLEYWRKENGEVEGSLRKEAPLYWKM
ncbi:rhodanese-like domain-containing protein [Chengkuizengella axinellae]|uniref:Rhodanese-like domain-containing protein n=1 Tax=Chengkuizengella axinellae TaxID=3064388 RepID=A0ABT9IUF2_9BACL|nr:rhodanese-like domain-containing protein [Chengkuizengella sp. 2205SS18-9]MDP5272961.1 rhodanese-like domain-containing protein [Chengkuizengella sp. 2205SS18-9]